jgi:hydrogenase large subunit
VGGVSNPIAVDSQSVLSVERLLAARSLIDELREFVHNVYMVDVAAVAAFYPEWTGIGAGVTNYLACPDYPLDPKGTQFATPGGYVKGGDLSGFTPIAKFGDEFLGKGVTESVKHSWYKGGKGDLHPYKGETVAEYTDFQADGKYSWVKSPMFNGEPAQVGPLSRVVCAVASKHEPTMTQLNKLIGLVKAVGKIDVPLSALHSTLGRHAARAVMCAVQTDILDAQWKLLMENLAKGDLATFNKPAFPSGEVRGFGFHEAPRGLLSHWVVIENGKIRNYQAVVPTTWNAAPRNEKDAAGPYEASLVGTPIANPEQPLEVLRTVHSFDPCLACAVHIVDTRSREIVRIRVQ